MAGFDEKEYEARYLPAIRSLFHSERIIADAFLRFGLELAEDDTAAIKAKTAAVLLYWARKFNHPNDGLLFKTLHGDSETRKEIEDPEKRPRLRIKVQDERGTRERKRIEELDKWINLAAAAGFLTPEGHASLVARLVGLGSDEPFVRKRLAGIPVREGKPVESLGEGLPEMIRKQVQTALTVLGLPDLYAFLMIPPNADAALWNERYNSVHDKSRKGGTGPQAEATRKLLGIIKQSILADPARYAKARDFVLAHSLEPKVQQVGIGGVISEKGYEALLAEGLSLGLSEKKCAAAIRWLAENHRIAIAVKSEDSDGSGTLCPACHYLIRSAAGVQNCPHCGQSIWTACPECTRRVLAGSSQCGLCGFPLARRSLVDSLLEIGAARLHAGNLKEVENCLDDLETVWIGGRVAKLRQEFERAVDGFESLATVVRDALSRHEAYRANNLIAGLRPAGAAYVFRDGSTVSALDGMVQGVLAEVEKKVLAARSALQSRDTNKAVGLFEDALRLVRDSAEAREGLSRCVPEPPTLLHHLLRTKSVSLTWTPSPAVGEIEYALVAGPDRAPRSVQDGEELGVTRDTSWEDETLKPGARRFYSVLARRSGAYSSALSSGEVVGEFEVRGLRVTLDENRVIGIWEPLPAGVRAVVTRTVNGQAAGTSAQAIASGASGFNDAAVSIGGEYEYRVAVEYSNSGRPRRTSGITTRVRLEAAPEPIAELKTRNKGRAEMEISWPPPPRGEVELYALPKPPDEKPGSKLDRKSLEPWRAYQIRHAGSSATWSRPAGGPRFITAVTVLNERAVMGPSVLDIPDVTGLVGTNEGSSIVLIWVWPEGCENVRVLWRHDRIATSPEDRMADRQDISLGGYHQQGAFRLANPLPKDYYFTIFPGTVVAGRVQYGGGSSEEAHKMVPGGSRMKIHYDIRKPLFRKHMELIVESASPGEALPEMRLIARTDGFQPTSVDQGQEVLHILNRTSPFETQFEMRRKGFLRLFLANPALTDRYQIMGPDPKHLNRTK